jgi:RNA-directed DNA polymerase
LADIEAYGGTKGLGDLAAALRMKTYRPRPVRRVSLPKPDGTQRPHGRPTIKARVGQRAAVVVVEPIFAAARQPEQHAYRPGRRALDAVRQGHARRNTGHPEVGAAEVAGYFATRPPAERMKSVSRRRSDRHLLRLSKRGREAPGAESAARGRHQRTTRHTDERRGCPPGAPRSPLLSNRSMRRGILGWQTVGHQQRLGARIVNAAAAVVIGCRGTAEEALRVRRDRMERLQRTVNDPKRRWGRIPDESVEFLGSTIGRCYSPKTGRADSGTPPAQQKVPRLCRESSARTSSRWPPQDVADRVAARNPKLTGWSNSCCLGPVSTAYAAVDRHACRRLRQWVCKQHKGRGAGTSRYPDNYLDQEWGLIRLGAKRRPFPWATA